MVIRASLELIHSNIFKYLPILSIRSRRLGETHQGQPGTMAGDGAVRHPRCSDAEVPPRRSSGAAHGAEDHGLRRENQEEGPQTGVPNLVCTRSTSFLISPDNAA